MPRVEDRNIVLVCPPLAFEHDWGLEKSALDTRPRTRLQLPTLACPQTCRRKVDRQNRRKIRHCQPRATSRHACPYCGLQAAQGSTPKSVLSSRRGGTNFLLRKSSPQKFKKERDKGGGRAAVVGYICTERLDSSMNSKKRVAFRMA